MSITLSPRKAIVLAVLIDIVMLSGLSAAQGTAIDMHLFPRTVPQVIWAYSLTLLSVALLVYAYRHRWSPSSSRGEE